MPWFWKSREQAEEDGSAMYAYGSKDAIKDFIERHGGAQTEAIVKYMDEVYGLDEYATREHLSDLSRGGELAPRYATGRYSDSRSFRTERPTGYQVPDEDVAPDGLSDWG